jgi:GMP synthase-like glutamine amidotransferase
VVRRYPQTAVKRALIVTHLEDRHTGLTRGCLERAGWPVAEWNPLDDVPAPPLSELSGIVSLGGRDSATAVDRHPFLAAEVELMRDALDAGVPILGMCLGAQLLAVAAGGRVSTMERMYVGWPELTMFDAARADPVFGGLESGLPVLKWHEDIIAVPEGSVALGATRPVPGETLFRIGSCAWGSQMHLELTPPMLVDGWLAEAGGIAEIESAGYDITRFRAESTRRLERQMAAAEPVFTRFAEFLLTREPPAPAGAHGPDSQGWPPSAGRWTASR